MRVIGVISDTHGLLRDEAFEALEGSELIIHAGDVGGQDILTRLAEIAPVHVVRGNTDGGVFGAGLPRTEVVDIGSDGDCLAYVIHDISELDIDPSAAGVSIVIYGHSHQPLIEERDGVVYFNPGAAGHRRFSLPVTVGRLEVAGGTPRAEIIDLEAEGPLPS